MNEMQTYAFAVTMTALVDVLKTATIAMMTLTMRGMTPEEREEVYAEIVRSAGDLPPDYAQKSPAGTKFHEDVAAAAPDLARAFACDLRKALG